MPYQFISVKLHGAIDYVVALVMIFAPTIFGFKSAGSAAVLVPMAVGAALFIYSLFTRYDYGVFKLMSLSYHLIVDIILSVQLIISPFIFMFSDEVWWPHVGMGTLLILVVIFSKVPTRRPVTPAM